MARTYTQKRRAEQQAETRRRIVEAAVELHGTIGPARTSVSLVAERAGVQRHTLYAHFPTERDLLLACSALSLEQSPLPDAKAWRTIRDRSERLRAGLSQMYDWYEANAELAGCVLRDAEHHELVREIAALRYGSHIKVYQQVLGAGLNAKQRGLLSLSLSFFTWRSLVRESGLSSKAAAALMSEAIHNGGRPA
jgi:AcrR family transcriptional regulator